MKQPNEKIKTLAVDILSTQDLPQDKFGSVIMIIMMVAILVNVIRVMQECNKNKKEDKVLLYRQHIQEICTYRGWFAKMRLRKIIRRELSPEDYKSYSASLTKAIFDKGERITEEEVKTLLEVIDV
jgi:hypothetical protein